jgi:predicted O-methyltransferase YrrM
MSILPRLFQLYRDVGYEPLTGYNPYHMGDHMDAPFTRFVHRRKLKGTPGLALQELMFVEGLAQYVAPKTILVIGNAHGWSTIALALMFPRCDVVAVDPDGAGNALTDRIARNAKLRIRTIAGYSPADVPRSLDVGLSLIDAEHKNDSLSADLEAVFPLLTSGSVVLMHDVINWNMLAAYHDFLSRKGMGGALLTRTPSGMAIAWKGRIPKRARAYIDVFADDPRLLSDYRKLLRQFPNRSAEEALRRFEQSSA